MNHFLFAISAATLVACAIPAGASAQTDAASKAGTAKTAPATAHKAASHAAPKKAPVKLSRAAAKAVEEVTPIDDDTNITLSEADLAVAQRVFVGPIKCELGANVTVTADEKRPGFFTVQTQRVRYRMHPVESRTGAIRLEDPKAGAMWLQLGNKSMLMNQKIGERLADECQSPQQVTVADEMKKNPPRGLLESADPKTATSKP